MTAKPGAWAVAKCAVTHWGKDDAATIGAALAFYCAFSLAPLLIILVTVTGWIVGTEIAYTQLSSNLTSLFGPATARVLLDAMESARETNGLIATLISLFTLLIGATTVFAALESALEKIWGAARLAPRGVYGWLRARVLSFGVILAVGFLLLISLSISTALAALRGFIVERFSALVVFVAALDFAITIALVTGLIALIYRFRPRSGWPGARYSGVRS
jgi:membrane protein